MNIDTNATPLTMIPMRHFILVFATVPFVQGLGGLCHNYVARTAANQVNDASLVQLINQYQDSYLVGSDFPDTGYAPGASYGEFAHWGPFLETFVKYTNQNYPKWSVQWNQTMAFILGASTHSQADIISHWTYYDQVALHDFHNMPDPSTAWSEAHGAMDPASDFYTIMKKQIYDHPLVWWVPVQDIINVYKMCNQTVSAEEIIKSNALYYLYIGLPEDLIATEAYLYYSLVKIPWGMANYENTNGSLGDLLEEIRQSAVCMRSLFYGTPPPQGITCYERASVGYQRTFSSMQPQFNPWMDFANDALSSGAVTVTPTYNNADGSVTFQSSSIQFANGQCCDAMNDYASNVRQWYKDQVAVFQNQQQTSEQPEAMQQKGLRGKFSCGLTLLGFGFIVLTISLLTLAYTRRPKVHITRELGYHVNEKPQHVVVMYPSLEENKS